MRVHKLSGLPLKKKGKIIMKNQTGITSQEKGTYYFNYDNDDGAPCKIKLTGCEVYSTECSKCGKEFNIEQEHFDFALEENLHYTMMCEECTAQRISNTPDDDINLRDIADRTNRYCDMLEIADFLRGRIRQLMEEITTGDELKDLTESLKILYEIYYDSDAI
jgi:hypothetical protein